MPLSDVYGLSLALAGGVATLALLMKNIETIGKPFVAFGRRVRDLVNMPVALNDMQCSLQKQIDGINDTIRMMHLQDLRCIIANPEKPIETRYEAGRDYVLHGGNGAIKHMYEDEIIPAYNKWIKERKGEG